MSEALEPDETTRLAEQHEADASHAADREATEDESRAADRAREQGEQDEEEVAAHYQEMAKRGAGQRGEGRIP